MMVVQLKGGDAGDSAESKRFDGGKYSRLIGWVSSYTEGGRNVKKFFIIMIATVICVAMAFGTALADAASVAKPCTSLTTHCRRLTSTSWPVSGTIAM